jgi:hypothetical protein
LIEFVNMTCFTYNKNKIKIKNIKSMRKKKCNIRLYENVM